MAAPKAKLATFIGLLACAFAGSYGGFILASTFITKMIATNSLLAASFCQAIFIPLGFYWGIAFFIQILKSGHFWPMEQHHKVNFLPAGVWHDLIFTLKRFDWELLKGISQDLLHRLEPRIIPFLTSREKPKTEGLWDTYSNYFMNMAKVNIHTLQEGIVSPVALRASIWTYIHSQRFQMLNEVALKTYSENERQAAIANDALKYASVTFITGFRKSEGFFETIYHALRYEFQHPPQQLQPKPQLKT
jgi:hypothetical protein